MPGFGDSAFIVILALLLFGPKKLPVLARQLGKLMGDFRRASNEFRAQMEEELRIAEQADRQKEIAALEAANTNKIAAQAETHTPPPAPNFASPAEIDGITDAPAATDAAEDTRYPETTPAETTEATPVPIATSGNLTMMPPETGLPIGRSGTPTRHDADPAGATGETELETETLHG
ncbi:MAG TPA: twin-arginine translocase TatA/TatE family subunit [Acidobacteriaceae bacterium]|nr:twin-arginine translocase TatA/TatE family subunit [Acidobacteriaceae bacterium]